MLKVSVIIPTFYDWIRLHHCLVSLSKQSYPKDLIEIIVINNAPMDQKPDDFLLPKNVTLISEQMPGSYAARNAGIRISQGEILAFTDSDCKPRADWLEQSVLFFQSNPTIDRIGGKIELFNLGDKSTIADTYEKVFAFRQAEFVASKGMAATANMISRKKVFTEIGLFNEGLKSGGDAEWGMRAQSSGFNIAYVEDIVVYHPSRSLLSEIVQKSKREAGGHLSLYKSYPHKVFFILLGFFPPLKSIIKISLSSNYTLKEKLISLSIRYYLRLVSTYEKCKVLFLGKEVERK